MPNTHTNYIKQLEDNIRNLEQENEVLSAKAEETILLNKAFEEIGLFTDFDKLLNDTLESIAILLDIPVTSLFDYSNKQFTYINGYSIVHDLDNSEVILSIPEKYLKDNLDANFHCIEEKNILIIKDGTKVFSADCVGFIALNSIVYKNRYFLFASDTCTEDLQNRIPILKKVIRIISRRLERIYYQKELEIVNKKLQTTNTSLNKRNSNLVLKNEIINAQNIELKRTMKYLKDAQAQLIESDKMASLGVLTAGIAHEINNPLNYIMGAHFGLESYFKKLDTKTDENVTILLDSIKKGIDRTANIVQGLGNFSRENEKYDENCFLGDIIENCLSILQYQIKNKTEIIKAYDNTLSVKGNVGKLHQLLLNIISNSLHAITRNGLIRIQVNRKEEYVEIKITDNGCGISEKDLNKITTPFYTTKEPGVGTGLGLSISYNIVKEHKGKLLFTSAVNVGTTVAIQLPL